MGIYFFFIRNVCVVLFRLLTKTWSFSIFEDKREATGPSFSQKYDRRYLYVVDTLIYFMPLRKIIKFNSLIVCHLRFLKKNYYYYSLPSDSKVTFYDVPSRAGTGMITHEYLMSVCGFNRSQSDKSVHHGVTVNKWSRTCPVRRVPRPGEDAFLHNRRQETA